MQSSVDDDEGKVRCNKAVEWKTAGIAFTRVDLFGFSPHGVEICVDHR